MSEKVTISGYRHGHGRSTYGNIIAHDLLRGIVDEDVQGSKLLHVLLDSPAARLVVHEVARDQKTLPALLLDHLLGVLGIGLLLWEIDDGDV